MERISRGLSFENKSFPNELRDKRGCPVIRFVIGTLETLTTDTAIWNLTRRPASDRCGRSGTERQTPTWVQRNYWQHVSSIIWAICKTVGIRNEFGPKPTLVHPATNNVRQVYWTKNRLKY